MLPRAPLARVAALFLFVAVDCAGEPPQDAPARRPAGAGRAEEAPPPRAVVTGLAETAPHPVPGRVVGQGLTLPRRHALIICGHPGDAEHTKTFTETVGKLREGLTRSVGIPEERQHVLFGAEKPKDLPGATGPSTREAVVAAVAEVRKALRPDDGLWVICLGHGHHDGRRAWWNLPGPDMDAAEFGQLFTDVTCKEQVFVMTFSLSGYFVSPLAKRDRVVIAATEADAETNETTFPGVFARILAAGLDPAEQDADKDGKLTLLDLYIAVTREIAQNFLTAELLATEHAQLDDDGDGVGHEVQNAYMPEKLGGTPPGKKANRRPHRDGVRAAQIPLLTDK
jgi:hypothetical protein